jgi:hypothetical protein
MKSYSNIFVILSDLARIQEEMATYPSHENKILQWQNIYHSSLKQLLSDLEFDDKYKERIKKGESLLFNMYNTFDKYAKTNISKEELESKLLKIFGKKQIEQRSLQWYDDMKTMLTASEFSKLFDSERTRGNLVISKVNPEKRENQKAKPTISLYPMDWGIRFEPIVKKYLEHLWNCEIYDCGRLKHDTYELLGASPDGIIINTDSEHYGRLLEIKCPYSRKIGGTVPFDYWVQMQIQLEVTNLLECEYVEVEILSGNSKNINPDLSGNSLEKGTMYLLEKEGNYIYSYSNDEKDKYILDNYNLIESIDYSIVKVHNVIVKRDSEWYKTTLSHQEKFWNDVEKARKNDFVVAEPKYKKEKKCLILEEN